MQDFSSRFSKYDKFVIVVDIVETSRITLEYRYLSYGKPEGVSDLHEAEFFDSLGKANQALAIIEPLPKAPNPFIFPVTVQVEVSFLSNYPLAYKLLKDRGLS